MVGCCGEVRKMEARDCSCQSEFQVAEESKELVQERMNQLRPHFRRQKAHEHAMDYLRGLIADVERKNGWQLAEYAGYRHPRGMQRVLDRYAWDHQTVREDLGRYVVAELGDPDGVLVEDETGFVKQGKHSVGVARQYCGTLGKIANCQIGVFLGYATRQGYAGIDGCLFVPQGWFQNPERCQRAGLPSGTVHRTKPQLALEMVESALDAGVPARWVVADEIYGSDGKLRRALEGRGQAYVLAVRSNEKPSTWPPYGPPAQVEVSDLGATIPAEGWECYSCGEGVQGPRLYDWAYLPLRPALGQGWVHALLVRRHLVRTEEAAYYPGSGGSGSVDGGGCHKGALACPEHISLTVPEIRRLLVRLLWAASHPPAQIVGWSRWRRRHQKRAQACHRRRRLRQKGEL